MIVKLLTEHHLEFLTLKLAAQGRMSLQLVKMPHCWKSHSTAHMLCITHLYLIFEYKLLYILTFFTPTR